LSTVTASWPGSHGSTDVKCAPAPAGTYELEATNHLSDGKVQGIRLNLVPSNAPATQWADGGAAAPTASIHCTTPTETNNPSNVDTTTETHTVCKNM